MTKDITKEMMNICIAFENIDGVTPDEISKRRNKTGYEHVNVHIIFYIRMDEKFTREAKLVAAVHTTAPPSPTKYSSVVSRESVIILFILAS